MKVSKKRMNGFKNNIKDTVTLITLENYARILNLHEGNDKIEVRLRLC
jgi:hypothetical protein